MNQHRSHLPAIALVAASSLVYEVLLTRVCALRLAFHFSFLAVGAAGAILGAYGVVATIAHNARNRSTPSTASATLA
jgi:hypothetical protein